MQKIERHTSVQRRRKSIIPLILSILVFLLALAPLSDLFRFGERELSFFVAIDIVTIIGFLVVYNIMKRHVSILFSSVQLGALALFGVATAHFLQNTPSYDTFFGIVRGTSAYLPLALFSLTILLVPFLTVTKNAIRAFFAIVFALPLLVLANQFLVDSIVPTAYVGVFVLFIGMFALPHDTAKFCGYLYRRSYFVCAAMVCPWCYPTKCRFCTSWGKYCVCSTYDTVAALCMSHEPYRHTTHS